MVRNLLAQAPECMARPKVLLLGISYPDVPEQMNKHGFAEDILDNSEPSVEQAVECVRRGILTEMDARDLARCVATEDACKVDVYSASKEIGAVYRSDRHIYGDFNSRNFCYELQQAFGDDVQFSQIILDYYWMPTGWLVTRWARSLFQRTLPDLVRYNMLTYPSKRGNRRSKQTHEEGVILLPFCAHVCKELVGAIDTLSNYFTISFVNKKDLDCHSLWKGTMTIGANVMQHRLGKRLDQEEFYCTFRPKDIYESMEDSHVSKPEVMRILMAIPDYDNIRMIKLKPLRQHEPPSVMRERLIKPEVGGFRGLDFRLGAKQSPKKKNITKEKVDPPSKKKQLKVPVAKKTTKKRPLPQEKPKPQKKQPPKKKQKVEVVSSSNDSSSSSESSDDESWDGEEAYMAKLPAVTVFFPGPALDVATYSFPENCEKLPSAMKKKKRRAATRRVLDAAARRAFRDLDKVKKKGPEYLSFNPRRNPTQRPTIYGAPPGSYVSDLHIPGVDNYRDRVVEGACDLFDMRHHESLKGVSRKVLKRKQLTCYKIPKQAICDALHTDRTVPVATLPHELPEDYNTLQDTPIFQMAVQACRGQWDHVLDKSILKAMDQHKIKLRKKSKRIQGLVIDRTILLDTVLRWLTFEREPSLDPTGELGRIFAKRRLEKKNIVEQAKTLEQIWFEQGRRKERQVIVEKYPEVAVVDESGVEAAENDDDINPELYKIAQEWLKKKAEREQAGNHSHGDTKNPADLENEAKVLAWGSEILVADMSSGLRVDSPEARNNDKNESSEVAAKVDATQFKIALDWLTHHYQGNTALWESQESLEDRARELARGAVVLCSKVASGERKEPPKTSNGETSEDIEKGDPRDEVTELVVIEHPPTQEKTGVANSGSIDFAELPNGTEASDNSTCTMELLAALAESALKDHEASVDSRRLSTPQDPKFDTNSTIFTAQTSECAATEQLNTSASAKETSPMEPPVENQTVQVEEPKSGTRVDATKLRSKAPRKAMPFKLHKILEDSTKEGSDKIISWLPDGRSFEVHDKKKFVAKILPRISKSKNFTAGFERNLRAYQFEIQEGVYSHPYFVRGRPDLCEELTTTTKGSHMPCQSSKKKRVDAETALKVANGPMGPPIENELVEVPKPTSFGSEETRVDDGKTHSKRTMFPVKLHKILEESDRDGGDEIISWLPDGKSFKVHDKGRFVAEIMPKVTKSKRFQCFERNLDKWQFQTHNDQENVYSHRQFVRGCPELCVEWKYDNVKKKQSNKRVSSKTKKDVKVAGSKECCLVAEKVETEAPSASESSKGLHAENADSKQLRKRLQTDRKIETVQHMEPAERTGNMQPQDSLPEPVNGTDARGNDTRAVAEFDEMERSNANKSSTDRKKAEDTNSKEPYVDTQRFQTGRQSDTAQCMKPVDAAEEMQQQEALPDLVNGMDADDNATEVAVEVEAVSLNASESSKDKQSIENTNFEEVVIVTERFQTERQDETAQRMKRVDIVEEEVRSQNSVTDPVNGRDPRDNDAHMTTEADETERPNASKSSKDRKKVENADSEEFYADTERYQTGRQSETAHCVKLGDVAAEMQPQVSITEPVSGIHAKDDDAHSVPEFEDSNIPNVSESSQYKSSQIEEQDDTAQRMKPVDAVEEMQLQDSGTDPVNGTDAENNETLDAERLTIVADSALIVDHETSAVRQDFFTPQKSNGNVNPKDSKAEKGKAAKKFDSLAALSTPDIKVRNPRKKTAAAEAGCKLGPARRSRKGVKNRSRRDFEQDYLDVLAKAQASDLKKEPSRNESNDEPKKATPSRAKMFISEGLFNQFNLDQPGAPRVSQPNFSTPKARTSDRSNSRPKIPKATSVKTPSSTTMTKRRQRKKAPTQSQRKTDMLTNQTPKPIGGAVTSHPPAIPAYTDVLGRTGWTEDKYTSFINQYCGLHGSERGYQLQGILNCLSTPAGGPCSPRVSIVNSLLGSPASLHHRAIEIEMVDHELREKLGDDWGRMGDQAKLIRHLKNVKDVEAEAANYLRQIGWAPPPQAACVSPSPPSGAYEDLNVQRMHYRVNHGLYHHQRPQYPRPQYPRAAPPMLLRSPDPNSRFR